MAMTVITLTRVPPRLRGDLTKWMQEIATGVYVGNFNPKVREELWKRVVESVEGGEATLTYHTNNELGYSMEIYGTNRQIVEIDGLSLVRIPKQSENNKGLKTGYSTQSKMRKAKYSKRTPITSNNCYVVLDIETDGLSPRDNNILELGAIKVTGKKKEKFHKLIKVSTELPKFIVELTGLTDKKLSNKGEDLKTSLKELVVFIGDYDIVGYNISFDIQFINYKSHQLGLGRLISRTYDLMTIVKKDNMFLPNYKLETVLKSYGIKKEVPHRALQDCELLLQLMSKVNVFHK